MDFTWDDEKAAENKHKHGIDFATASLAFFDPGRIEEYDIEHSENEDRWITVGLVRNTLLFVVFAEREGDVIRIISARKAMKNEQKAYYQAQS
jgi:Uncharacterized protein conserved in bacteria